MKKVFVLTICLLIVFSGCLNNKKENLLKENWNLSQELKPDITFERSNKNNDYEVFYADSQIKFDDFLNYLNILESKGFAVDWRYSDTKTIKELEDAYASENKNSPFNDGYSNFMMCGKDNEIDVCFFMQWVNKKVYNTLNKDKPTSYSFKLEIEKLDTKTNDNETKK